MNNNCLFFLSPFFDVYKPTPNRTISMVSILSPPLNKTRTKRNKRNNKKKQQKETKKACELFNFFLCEKSYK